MKIGKEEAENLYISLVHYPVLDKKGNIIATSITNYDLHDLSRLAKTYSLAGYFLVTPLEAQIELMKKIVRHWIEGKGRKLHPNRGEALKLARFVHSIDEMIKKIEEERGHKPITVATTAREGYNFVDIRIVRNLLIEKKNIVIIFGTGYGLADEVLNSADYILEPIRGFEYNHLSVRSAASIIVDRLFNC